MFDKLNINIEDFLFMIFLCMFLLIDLAVLPYSILMIIAIIINWRFYNLSKSGVEKKNEKSVLRN